MSQARANPRGEYPTIHKLSLFKPKGAVGNSELLGESLFYKRVASVIFNALHWKTIFARQEMNLMGFKREEE